MVDRSKILASSLFSLRTGPGPSASLPGARVCFCESRGAEPHWLAACVQIHIQMYMGLSWPGHTHGQIWWMIRDTMNMPKSYSQLSLHNCTLLLHIRMTSEASKCLTELCSVLFQSFIPMKYHSNHVALEKRQTWRNEVWVVWKRVLLFKNITNN